jgi:putative membrane protein
MSTSVPTRASALRIVSLAFVALAAAMPAYAQAGKAAKLDDPTIIAIFDAANTWDMETGAIGEKKATNKDVRDLAAQLVRDHRAVRQQGRDLVKKLGVTPTPPKNFAMAKDHEEAVKKLDATNGKAFDRVFLEHEIAYHKAVIDAVTTTLLPALQNQEARDLVTKVAPAFKAHMDAAQNLLDKLPK